MTFRSRKKLRITLRSMLPWKPASLVLAGLALAAGFSPAADSAEPGDQATRVESDDPLQRLRNRDVDLRWKSVTDDWRIRNPSWKPSAPDTQRSTARRITSFDQQVTPGITPEPRSPVPTVLGSQSAEAQPLPDSARRLPQPEQPTVARSAQDAASVMPSSRPDSFNKPIEARSTSADSVGIGSTNAAAPAGSSPQGPPAVTTTPAIPRVTLPLQPSTNIQVAARPQTYPRTIPPAPTGTVDAAQMDRQYALRRIDEIDPYLDYKSGVTQSPADNMLPEEFELGATSQGPQRPYQGRAMPDMLMSWKASNLSHKPLYFQDVQLERYGYTHHPVVQPFVSVTRFGVQLIGLPYQAAIHPYHKDMYTLGYYRPGEWAPPRYYQIPLNVDAIALQTAATMGAFIIFP